MLRRFDTLSAPVMSPSGMWALSYVGGRASIADHNRATTWTAGAAGVLRLEPPGVFAVYQGDQVVWRGDLPEFSYSALRVTDDGDGIFHHDGLPVHSLRHGPIEPVSLGGRAPAANIHSHHILTTSTGAHTVHRGPDGVSLVVKTKLGVGAETATVVPVGEARSLDRPNTWLTWQFLVTNGRAGWRLVLIDGDDEVLWVHGANDERPHEDEPDEDDEWPQPWFEIGLLGMDTGYCITVIHDVTPDEALRRFGAREAQISTSTWAELLLRARHEEALDHHVVAAFRLGPHTMLVEDNGSESVNRPDLSSGTFAVSSYCSVNADQTFLVSRDRETLARFDDNRASEAAGADVGVLARSLSAMGIDDPEEFDEDEDFLEDLELLCRLAGVRPAVADVSGPARVTILRRDGRTRLRAT